MWPFRQVAFFIFLLSTFFAGNTWSAQSKAVEKELLTLGIERATKSLMKLVKPNGQFIYKLNLNPEVEVQNSYNILRHAGSIYALSMSYLEKPEPEVKHAILQTGMFLKRETLAPMFGEGTLAVWSLPEVNRLKKLPQVKLGGLGLGLTALVQVKSVSQESISLKALQAIAQSILYMIKEDGDYYSKFIPAKGGLQDNWRSLYYPGEAALGLLSLYEIDPSPIWFEGAYSILAQLAEERKNSSDVLPDHWALIATNKLLTSSSPKKFKPDVKLLKDHVAQICLKMLGEQLLDRSQLRQYGGFVIDTRTTPTATRLEGLLAAYEILEQDSGLRKKILKACDLGIAFLLDSQIKKGKYQGMIPRAKLMKLESLKGSKAFNKRVSEVRIDYIQHGLSAFVQYSNIRYPY